MKKIFQALSVVTLALGLVAAPAAFAAKEKKVAKERTITGELQCAKCNLKQSESCQNVLVAEIKGAKQTLWLEQNDLSKGFHEQVCKEAKKATVTGVAKKEKGTDKLVVTAAKIELIK